MWVTITATAATALAVVAVLCAWRAVATARTPQGAVGWVVFLLTTPWLAVPLYLVLGHHRYRGYRIGRRDSERVVEGVRRFSAANRPSRPMGHVSAAPFEAIARLPPVRGNDIGLLIDGPETFGTIFAAIDAADRYVLVQFYIIHDDDLGRALRDRLIGACIRGVEVRLMFDTVGSGRLPESYLDPLREAGARVMDRSTARGPTSRLQINYRNHRKTVIVDGKTGFTGGLNVGDEYLGLDPDMGPWRDTHVELRGPVVTQLQLIFAEDWYFFTGESILDALDWSPGNDPADRTALVIATGPGDDMETGAMFFFSAITQARERLWIASPYFVPDTDILSALKHAALRGVEVRLLLPDSIDHRIPWLAAFAYFDEVRAAGVEIWRYREGFMHQKVVLVDDVFAAVGTHNLDNRSFRLNFEAVVAVFDSGFAEEVATMLAADFERAAMLDRVLSEQRLAIRLGAPVARLFAPLL